MLVFSCFVDFFNPLLKETFQNGIFFALPVSNSLNTNLVTKINQWPKRERKFICHHESSKTSWC